MILKLRRRKRLIIVDPAGIKYVAGRTGRLGRYRTRLYKDGRSG